MPTFVTLFGFVYYCSGSGHQVSLITPAHLTPSWMLILWIVYVLKPLLPFVMHGTLSPVTAGLRAAMTLQILILFSSYSILPLIPWEDVTDGVWQEYVKRFAARTKYDSLCEFWPLMNVNDGSKDEVLRPVSHMMKPKSRSPIAYSHLRCSYHFISTNKSRFKLLLAKYISVSFLTYFIKVMCSGLSDF